MGIEARLRERIHREGPISFADFQEAALYDAEHGFFTRGGGAGRAGRDFVTSPEVGSLFGMVIARALDDVWHRLGEPDPFVVVEAGAGRGRLGADVVRAAPDCLAALRYVMVERSAQLRDEQRERMAVEPPDEALGPFLVLEEGEAPEPQGGQGPIVTALDELPAVRVTGVVVANELLDNLPVHVVERGEDGWLEQVGMLLRRGEVILFDYVDTASSLAARGQGSWMRTYRAHQRGIDPLEHPGEQDITCDVPLEYLRRITERVGLPIAEYVPQREWMGRHGIVELVAEGDRLWQEGAARGDLTALAGRSRGVEAAALTDPGGLGAHRVLVLRREGAG